MPDPKPIKFTKKQIEWAQYFVAKVPAILATGDNDLIAKTLAYEALLLDSGQVDEQGVPPSGFP